MTRLRLPDRGARPAIVALVLVWTGVACGRVAWWIGLAAIAVGLIVVMRGFGSGQGQVFFALAALVAGGLVGMLAAQRNTAVLTAEIPLGPNTALMIASTDQRPSPFGGGWFVARPVALRLAPENGTTGWIEWRGPPLVIYLAESEVPIEAGQRLEVVGRFRFAPGAVGGSTVAGRVNASRIEVVTGTDPTFLDSPLVWAGNSLRDRVIEQVGERGRKGALVAGFLVGAVDDLPEVDIEALRLAGLSHFVAVSGANVAQFLLLWFIVLGPLGVGGRRRGILGLIAIAVFAVATRWEPSVVRASVMAGMVMAGRVVGIPVDSWMALGWSGSLVLLVAPDLAMSLGFQLSVLATAGIMSGGDLLSHRLPHWLRGSLGPTLAAQAAVTPLILNAFGSVPLVSPLSNLVAMPLVAAATLAGGIGTLSGLDPLISLAAVIAGWILDLAHLSAGLPQLDWFGVMGAGAVLIALRSSWLRPIVVLIASVALVWGSISGAPVPLPAVVFLDVGQGDASLIFGSDGSTVLVDAGPEPSVLAAALRKYRVTDIDLLVLTHPHEDHVAGLVGLVERLTIGRVWIGGDEHSGDSWEIVQRELTRRGVPIETPVVGASLALGDVALKVLGPLRRYEGANDQSVVVMVTAGATSVLLTGDIEFAAQADLGVVVADVLKVPHHGGATSSLSWIAAVNPMVAVVSVGENDYGHPSPAVIETLAARGTVVIRTDEAGDVVIPLAGIPMSDAVANPTPASRLLAVGPGRVR